MSEENQNEGLQNLLKKYDSDWAALAGELYSQTGKLREKNRTLESTIGALEQDKQTLEGKLPKDGSRVLGKDESKEYDAFKALNLKPEEVKARLEQADSDRSALLTVANKEALALRGLKPGVLELKKAEGAVFTSTREGDAVKTTVKQGETETPFEQWVEDNGLADVIGSFAAATERAPVFTGRGSAGGGDFDPVSSYNQQTYGKK